MVDLGEGTPVAVITGASSGIGFASADALLRAGYRVAFFSQQPERVATSTRALAGSYGNERVRSAVVDLRDPEAVRGFFREHPSRLAGSDGPGLQCRILAKAKRRARSDRGHRASLTGMRCWRSI
ncbi:SDR family NAD(P)-dependent oxidoreductase [Mesorhizobium atlanticum]